MAVTLGTNYVRRGKEGYGNDPQNDTTNFVEYPAAVKSIVTSNGQNDGGIFEVNLRDERYLPFEGAGVLSTWLIEFLGKPKPFDYDTISDVVLTIRYTARVDGNRSSAETAADNWLKSNSARLFSMRHEFASEWAAFKNPISSNGGKASLKFSLGENHFPYRLDTTVKAKRFHFFFSGSATGNIELRRDSQPISGPILAESERCFAPQSPFQATGLFELLFDSNAIEDLLVVLDWS
ncbi:MAG: hypothetical protein V2B19_02600 [Pseudomonadota bacterium]